MGLFNRNKKTIKERQIEIEERLREKEVNKLKSQMGIEGYLCEEDWNNAILEYVKKGNSINSDVLTNEQRNNNEFMLSLYKAYPSYTTSYEFLPTDEQKKDKDFMVEFYTIRQSRDDYSNLSTYWEKDLLRDAEFVEKLAEKNPNLNVVNLVDYIISTTSYVDVHAGEKVKELIRSLDSETLSKQIKTFGSEVLKKIPNDHAEYATLVESAVEMEGYDGLKYLGIDQVLDNKELIYKAYEKDGIEAVVRYLKRDLNPNRNMDYMCHGDYHSYTTYDKRYEEVRDELLEDDNIKTILEDNGLKTEKSYRVYQDLEIKEMEA